MDTADGRTILKSTEGNEVKINISVESSKQEQTNNNSCLDTDKLKDAKGIEEKLGSKQELKIMALNDTKAGMQGLDVDKINQIIQESSKGSKFYEHKRKRQEQLDKKVDEMKAQLASMSKEHINRAEKQVNLIAKEMEERRDLSRVIVHLDMDAFFASVEIRDDPSLRDKPMAVGSLSMLSTSNYLARRFGIRAGMPGFIGKKLCPQLVIVPPNFAKYSQASKEVEEVLTEYDRESLSMSMDEAYIDITDYLAEKNAFSSDDSQITVEDIVQEMRQKIFEKTQLTASAGIAANGLLAKICGDIKKPNDQYYLEPTVDAIKSFMKTLPIRKVCGIGAVTEQLLKGLDIHSCGDLFEKRAVIQLLFKPATSSFLLQVSLGVGNSFFSKDTGSDDRKSMSCERTFSGTSDTEFLKEMCKDLCEELQSDLQRKGVTGKTITLKIKTVNFEVKTRARSIADYTSNAIQLFEAAWAIYSSYESENEGLKLRLMGVRVSNLRFKNDDGDRDDALGTSSKQKTIEEMFAKTMEKRQAVKQYPCPVCEELFDSIRDLDFHIDSCLTEIPTSEKVSHNSRTTEDELNNTKQNESDGSEASTSNNLSVQHSGVSSTSATIVKCPICNLQLKFKSASEAESNINFHIDECLNKNALKEMREESNSGNEKFSGKRTHDFDGPTIVTNKKKKQSSSYVPIDSYFKPNTQTH